MRTKAKTVDFTRGNITKELIVFAIPLFFGSIFSLLYNIVDTMVLGRFVSVGALAAVGATTTTHMVVTHLSNALSNALSIQVSQEWGAGHRDRVRRIVGNNIVVTAAVGIFLMFAMTSLARVIMQLLRTPADIIDDATLYVRITCGFFIGQLFYNMATSVLRAIGDSSTPLLFLVFSSVLNAVLDLVFVVCFHWDVVGVAWATVVSQVISAATCLFYMFRKHVDVRITAADLKPDKAILLSYGKIALPMAFQSGMLAVGDLIVSAMINSFGTAAVAAFTVGQKCLSIVQITYSQITFSISVFTGQNYGARQYERIRQGVRKALTLICSLCAVSMAVMLLFKDQLMWIYIDPLTSGEAVQALTREYLTVTAFFMPALAVILMFLAVLRGMGEIPPTVVSSFVELACKIGCSILLSHWFGTVGLWFALPVGWVLGLIPPMQFYYFGKWEERAEAKLAAKTAAEGETKHA